MVTWSRRQPWMWSLLAAWLALGCATTRVIKNPNDCEEGIRYYRPKPYLLIQPSKGESQEFVAMSLHYLPDFSEEYAIQVRAGLGLNKTKITLKDGWNLTQLDADLDSNVDDNIDAIANLVKAAGGIAKTAFADTDETRGTAIRANNVPFGYYESVVNKGPDGKKRLYGWRYVGFYPFDSCPIDAAGQECVSCFDQVVYGLIFEKGVMTFAPLPSIPAGTDLRRVHVATLPQPADDAAVAKQIAEEYIADQAWRIHLADLNVVETPDEQIHVIVSLRNTTFRAAAELETARATMEAKLTQLLKDRFKQETIVVVSMHEGG